MEKRGDITDKTPQPQQPADEADNAAPKQPTTKRAADDMEDHPLTRASEAARRQAAKND